MEQIIMMRENGKPDSFSEAEFKNLNKNDIENLYYLCQNKKVNYRETKLMNSLITFIRSCVIWERVYDFQLGIEGYQIKINLTAPTLTFPRIEAHESYSIVDKPSTGLIYLNSKEEKRVMYLIEIVKFCDATLEKVLNEVKLKIFQSEPWRKSPLLGELDHDILTAFEREINKRLRHQDQMRRWESFLPSYGKEFMISSLAWRATSRKSILLHQQSRSLALRKKNFSPSPLNLLPRVLEGLEKYNKDVKYGYADPSPSDTDVEYLRFHEKDIRECLKHQDQMRHWEMYVNGRPLGSRRDSRIAQNNRPKGGDC
ncbi:hypothetical protein Tco_0580226 [Tanacetum coccineum]